MRILVTGVNGFVGKHLARELSGRGHEVIGVGRNPRLSPDLREHVPEFYDCDLTDAEQVHTIPLDNVAGVISLAGLASVGASFDDPDRYKRINVGVLTKLCQRMVDEKIAARVIAISTGAIYDARQSLPLTEDSKLITTGSPYAISKLKMEDAARDFHSKGLDCIIVRPFNHIGPGQETGFLVPDLYQKIISSQKNGHELKTGNLKTKRDYTDVRDVVKAYADLVTSDSLKHNTYNICSGMSVAGQEILDQLLKLMGVSVKVELDPALMRPSDNPDLYGSYQRLRTETGWQPKIPLQKTIEDFVKSKD